MCQEPRRSNDFQIEKEENDFLTFFFCTISFVKPNNSSLGKYILLSSNLTGKCSDPIWGEGTTWWFHGSYLQCAKTISQGMFA